VHPRGVNGRFGKQRNLSDYTQRSTFTVFSGVTSSAKSGVGCSRFSVSLAIQTLACSLRFSSVLLFQWVQLRGR
jgi:hypothetical protein